MFTEGLISVLLGILIMVFPGQTLKLFFVFIGIWALLLGLFKIYIAIVLRNMKEFRWLLVIGGIGLFAIGLLLLLDPSYVAGTILMIVGIIFVVLGMMFVYFSFSLRAAVKEA